MRLLFLLALIPAVALAGCDSTDPRADCEAIGFDGTGTLTATAGGQSFRAACVKGQLVNNVLTLGGSESADAAPGAPARQLGLSIKSAQPGGGSLIVGTYVNVDVSDPTSGTYTATAGTVRIEAVSATGAKGTFSFEASNPSAAVAVTDGRFDITF